MLARSGFSLPTRTTLTGDWADLLREHFVALDVSDIEDGDRFSGAVHSAQLAHVRVASDSFDKAKAQAQITKMEEQHKGMMLSRLETQNKIYNILTPEQKKQFNANFEKRLTEHKAPAGKMPPAPAE